MFQGAVGAILMCFYRNFTESKIPRGRPLRWVGGFAVLFLLMLPGSAQAACSTPTGAAGDVIWSSASNAPAYCNDTDWVGFPNASGAASWSSPSLSQTLSNPTPAAGDEFGYAIDIDGGLVLVGVYADDPGGVANAGSAYVFDATTGALVSTLSNPSPVATDSFGRSVGISGNLAVVGAYGDDTGVSGAGIAYVFNATTGALVSTLNNPAPLTNDSFGWSADISGSLAIIGAYADDPGGVSNTGAAYVFNANTGALVSTLSNPAPAVADNFGYVVAISGTRALVGSRNDDPGGVSSAGGAFVFDANTGALIRELVDPNRAANNFFGDSLDLEDDIAAVGAPGHDLPGGQGAVYLFDVTDGSVLHTITSPVPADEYIGNSVSLSDGRVLVGSAWTDMPGGVWYVGRAYLYDISTGGMISTIDNPDPSGNEFFGLPSALSGDVAALSVYRDSGSIGVAYLFAPGTGGGCANPVGVVGDILYNTTSHVLQYCDGHAWYAAGSPGNGGAGCTSPTGAEGAVTYNTTHNVLQYCEGDVWMAVGDFVPPTCGGVVVGTYCWYYGGDNQSCNTVCASRGGCNAAGISYAAGSTANCTAVLDAIGAPGGAYYFQGYGALNIGCSYATGNGRVRDTSNTCGGALAASLRACACNN